MKKIFTLLFIALMSMSFSMQAQEPIGIYQAYTTIDDYWDPNYEGAFMVDGPIQVETYDGYLIVRGWTGVEGHDLKVAYDADENVTSLTLITDGVEGKATKSGYSAYTYTGLTGAGVYVGAYFYIGEGYDYAAYDEEGGYVALSLYAYDQDNNAAFVYYYIAWEGEPSGIAGVAADNAAPRYYDLNGMEVSKPTTGRVYIRVAGSNATKTIVK